MDEFEYLEKSKNEIITIDNLNKKRLKPAFGDDCFIRYLFSDEGNENIVLDFINGVMIDLNFQTFNNVVILNPSPTAGFSLNLTKYLDGKESIVDVPKGRRAKCITEDNQTVIIEIQLQGNQYFIRRSLYYWANSYSSLLNKSENYTKLSPVISINVLDFILFNDIKDFHSCYLLKEIKHNKILTDHCMLHYIELPKFNLNNDKEKLSSWIKFFKGENMSNLIKENNIFEEVEKRCQSFIDSDPLINAYRKKEWNEYFHRDELEEAKKEGRIAEQISMATAMKKDGADINLISKYTGLNIEEIEKL